LGEPAVNFPAHQGTRRKGPLIRRVSSGGGSTNSTPRAATADAVIRENRKGVCTLYTPRKINMEPENDDLEDDFPFQSGDF